MYPAANEFELGMVQHTLDRGRADRPGCPLDDPQAHAPHLTFSRERRPSVASLDHPVPMLGVSRPHGFLVVLAHTGARNLVDERPPLRQPPANDLVREEPSQLLRADRPAVLGHDYRERAFLPALVGNPDHRGLEDVRMPDQAVLQLDRGDPFPTGLDDVLGSGGAGGKKTPPRPALPAPPRPPARADTDS